jgi:HEAT repeat protein/calcineurin-like phosphoesterase family protein/purple acid phosphatase-like protein
MRSVRQFALVCALAALLGSPLAVAEGFYIAPHLQNVTPDGATLIWETAEESVGVVAYGPEGSYDQQVTGAAAAKIKRVRITGLQPDTAYSYRIREGSDESVASFKTAPVEEREIVFAVLGDSRRWDGTWEATKMAEHAAQWGIEVYLNMGDLVPNGHVYEQWPENFQRFADINTTTWIATARGNHEGSQKRDVENDWYAKYHELPGEGEPYASFTWGNTHFVLISYEDTRKAADWLDTHLETVDKPWVVAAHHYPIYCTGYHSPTDSRKEVGDSLKKLAKVVDKHDVDLDLSGHTHIYERIYPLRDGKRNDTEGTTYIINGGDIRANYPDWWSAVTDDRETMDKPTYSVFHAKHDRLESRTFCWSKVEEKIVLIDYNIIWKDESLPRGVLASLGSLEGEQLVQAIADLGAMIYGPAADKLMPYLAHDDTAVRHAAATAIRAIGSEAVAKDLIDYLGDDDLHVRREAARAIEIAMPTRQAKTVAKHVLDKKQDRRVRLALVGALQFHAPDKAKEVAISLLQDDDTASPLRERAAYALGRVVERRDAPTLARLFREEPQGYVMVHLAYTLNEVTGKRQSLDDEGSLYRSSPGQARDEFIDKWLGNVN